MAERLVDIFFQKNFFEKLCAEISKHYPGFDSIGFKEAVHTDNWLDLALKQRMQRIVTQLSEHLPFHYDKQIEILLKTEHIITHNFEHTIFSEFVEMHGLNDYDTSMIAIEVFTKSTSELAIRPFLNQDYKTTIKIMTNWSTSEHIHLRRLASEGSRPYLPWAKRVPPLIENQKDILKILENLKDDESEYVRRSVANNLNDISKIDPESVLTIAKRWHGQNSNRDRLVKHGLRTLLKRGNKDAMKLFGFKEVNVTVTKLDYLPEIIIGTAQQLDFTLMFSSPSPNLIRVEYVIHFLTSTGKISKKVFKLFEKSIDENSLQVKKTIVFKPLSTRKLFPGSHKIEIVINGYVKETIKFNLVQ
jgi:3-methyladenine DNA glycosylase AlkC